MSFYDHTCMDISVIIRIIDFRGSNFCYLNINLGLELKNFEDGTSIFSEVFGLTIAYLFYLDKEYWFLLNLHSESKINLTH